MTDIPEDVAAETPAGERIAKRLARAGVCSRRDAERMIAEGRVAVDGVKLTTPATLVTDDNVITVDGKPIAAKEPTRLWRYHKPKGLVTSHRDPEGRPTLFANLPPDLPRVISVGRLDFNSEGLLLLTNDGELSRRLELPATGWLRRYRVRVHGEVTAAQLASLVNGVEVEGVRYGSIEATFDKPTEDVNESGRTKANRWLTFSLREGKNREVRRIAEHLGLVVTRLIRVSYGPFQLGYLEPGQVEEVPARILRDQLGKGEAVGVGAKPPRLHAKAARPADGKTHSYPSKARPPKTQVARADNPEEPRGDRPPMSDRPGRPGGSGAYSDKPRGPRGAGPRGEGPRGDKPWAARSDKPPAVRSDKPRSDKPRSDRPKRSDQAAEDRPEPVPRERPRAPWATGRRGEPPANSLPPKPKPAAKAERSSRPGKPKAPRADRRR